MKPRLRCAETRFAKLCKVSKGFNWVCAKLLVGCADSRFAKPRTSRKGNGFILFACTKRTGSTPEVCEPLDSRDDSNLRSIRNFSWNDRRSSSNRRCRRAQPFRVSPVRIWIGAKLKFCCAEKELFFIGWLCMNWKRQLFSQAKAFFLQVALHELKNPPFLQTQKFYKLPSKATLFRKPNAFCLNKPFLIAIPNNPFPPQTPQIRTQP